MMKRTLVLALLLPLLACSPDSPEAQVKKAFETCVNAVESGDPAPVIELLSKDFAGPEGMGKNEAKLYLAGILSREKIGVTVFSNRVEIKGNRAEQGVELMLTSKGEGFLPQDASRRLFLLRWEKQKGKWLLREMQESK
jgi:hypothetical protein